MVLPEVVGAGWRDSHGRGMAKGGGKGGDSEYVF